MSEAAPQAAAGTGANIDEADDDGPGEATPEALAAEFPQWRIPAQAGDAWITMRPGPQEYHGPESLIRRTLSAETIGELAGKLQLQTHLDELDPDQLAAAWRELRGPTPESAAVR
jgi:hypothetical protein